MTTVEIRVEQEGNRVKKERKAGEKRKIINVASAGNRTRDLSITDLMSVLTNQVHLKIQFRHTDLTKSAHLQTRYTDSVLASLEIIYLKYFIFGTPCTWGEKPLSFRFFSVPKQVMGKVWETSSSLPLPLLPVVSLVGLFRCVFAA